LTFTVLYDYFQLLSLFAKQLKSNFWLFL